MAIHDVVLVIVCDKHPYPIQSIVLKAGGWGERVQGGGGAAIEV